MLWHGGDPSSPSMKFELIKNRATIVKGERPWIGTCFGGVDVGKEGGTAPVRGLRYGRVAECCPTAFAVLERLRGREATSASSCRDIQNKWNGGGKTGAIHVYFSHLEAMRADGQQSEQNLSHFLWTSVKYESNVRDGPESSSFNRDEQPIRIAC
jgi:hypothetical protein